MLALSSKERSDDTVVSHILWAVLKITIMRHETKCVTGLDCGSRVRAKVSVSSAVLPRVCTDPIMIR